MRKAGDSIDSAKEQVAMLQGKPIRVRYNRGRNKIVYYSGEISEIYGSVFIIKINDELFDRLSCSYKDVLCGDVKFSLLASGNENKLTVPS